MYFKGAWKNDFSQTGQLNGQGGFTHYLQLSVTKLIHNLAVKKTNQINQNKSVTINQVQNI